LLAKGGTVRSAGSAVVGDRGPELLSLPKGAGVTPISPGGSGGGMGEMGWHETTINVPIDGKVAASVVLKHFGNRLARA